jgi:FkbM family methyltransferase
MKNIFIDCGTNLGQGLTHFDRIYQLFNSAEWDICTFEPNPHINLNDMFKNISNLEKIERAVWVREEELEFCCKGKNTAEERHQNNEERFQGGGSQLNALNIQEKHPSNVESISARVKAINFSDFILQKKDMYDKIFVKFDIEGAEFEVIDKLISDDTLKYIEKLYIEPHGRFLFQRELWETKKEEIKEIEDILINKIKAHTKVVLWH